MTSEKVGLREQLLKKAFNILDPKTMRYDEEMKQDIGIGVDVVKLKDVEKILAPFLDASPQTREIQKLLEERPKYEKGIHCKSWAYNDVEYWFAKFVPKLEAFCADHVSREQVQTLYDEYKLQLTNLESYEKDVEKLSEYAEGQRSIIKEVLECLVLLTKKEGREALVARHQDEAVGSPQSQDAQSRVKDPPPSTIEKGGE